MNAIRTLFVKCLAHKGGSAALEYALILGLMIVALVASLTSTDAETTGTHNQTAVQVTDV